MRQSGDLPLETRALPPKDGTEEQRLATSEYSNPCVHRRGCGGHENGSLGYGGRLGNMSFFSSYTVGMSCLEI